MTFSTDSLAERAATVQRFGGTQLASVSDSELVAMQSAAGELWRVVGVLVAQLAGEAKVRDARASGMLSIARQQGYRSPQELIAATLGVSHGEAGKLMSVGELLVETDVAPQPCVAAALRDTPLGVEKAAVLKATLTEIEADGMGSEALRALEQRLVAKALTVSLWDLKKICASERAKAAILASDAREIRQHEARCLTLTPAADGMVAVHGLLDPPLAASLGAWLDAQVGSAFAARRDHDTDTETDKRSAAQIRADALGTLAEHGLSCDAPGSGLKTTVVLRVDKSDLESGLGLATCDSLAEPISIAMLRRMAVDAQIIPAVMGGDSVVLDWGRARRLYSRDQFLALVERDGGCSSCHAPPSYCHTHHIRWWKRDNGPTDLDNGLLLCAPCHHRIHETSTRITVRGGIVTFTLPDGTRRLGGRAHLALA